MSAAVTLSVTAFLTVSSLIMLLFLSRGRPSRLTVRMQELAGKEADEGDVALAQVAQTMLPRIGSPLMPEVGEDRSRLQTRLIHAGCYGKDALAIFLGVKMLLIVAAMGAGLVAGLAGFVPMHFGLLFGGSLGVMATIGPNIWLDKSKSARQRTFSRGLPDALDVLVICLEGGLSLTAALKRVASELRTAHPQLGAELQIVLRGIQLGQTSGEAMREFATRADMEELRSLGSVILQSERLGASLASALRVHSETLRFRRLQYAEEMAQKATVKMLFPTLLLIFPGVFVVILGPAVVRILDLFGQMK